MGELFMVGVIAAPIILISVIVGWVVRLLEWISGELLFLEGN